MKTKVLHALRLIALLAAAALVAVASIDVFDTRSFTSSVWALKVQALICVIMIFEMGCELILSDHRVRYFITHLPLFILCIPYGAVLWLTGITLPDPWNFVLQIVPILRAIFVLADLLRALRFGSIGSVLGAYIALVSAIVYFSSLIFYITESPVNTDVHSFRSAFYWAFMCLTTTGSNIPETTEVGQALATVLSATGLILFPVFTVYIATAVSRASGHQS